MNANLSLIIRNFSDITHIIPVKYDSYLGSHTWDYWIQAVFDFIGIPGFKKIIEISLDLILIESIA